MYRIVLTLALAGLLLAGCGGGAATGATMGGGNAPSAATTPEQVHSA